MIGQTISHYKIVEKLGEGGMGVVYKAHDTKLDRTVALKFLPPDLTRDLEARERFVQEAQAASSLQHANICTIHEIDETQDGETFICMDYYEGRTLSALLRQGSLPIQKAVNIAKQIVQGMARAHDQGITHRDIKPSNIIVTNHDEVKILDFGLAKLAWKDRGIDVGKMMGTTAYMSPEQIRGEEIGQTSDVWSIGVVLHETLTSKAVFSGKYESVMAYQILNVDPPSPAELRPEIPADLCNIVEKCLRKIPEHRYQHARNILIDLEKLEKKPGATGEAVSNEFGRPPKGDTELKQVTVLHLRLAYDEIVEELGLEGSALVLSKCFSAFSENVRKYGGVIDKTTERTLVAVFGVPVAVEDAPRRAVNVAIALRNCASDLARQEHIGVPIRPMIGISTGPSIANVMEPSGGASFSVFGQTGDLAQGMAGAAKNGQVLVGPLVHRYTKNEFEYRPLPPMTLGERKEPVQVFELLSATERLHRPQPSVDRKIYSRMIGRDNELSILKESVLKVINGKGSIVSVIGEAGIGKSRMILELLELDEIGKVIPLTGRALSVGANLSFHPLVDLLKNWAGIEDADDPSVSAHKLERTIQTTDPDGAPEVFPFIATLMGFRLWGKHQERLKGVEGEALEKLIQKSLRELLEKLSSVDPVLVVIEDLHWADISTIGFLEVLYRMVHNHRILFVNVFRPGYEKTGERILDHIVKRFDGFHSELYLEPLNQGECENLIQNLLNIKGLPIHVNKLLVDRAEGNPFFIEEAARSFLDDGVVTIENGKFTVTEKINAVSIPESINDLIISRVDKLDEQTKALLKLASVIGRNFFYRILADTATAIEGIDDKLFYLKEIQLIKQKERREELEYLFKHALAREAIYDSILLAKKKEMHLQVARSIESVFRGRLSEFYGVLALHYGVAEDREKVEEYLIKAGEEALKSAASIEAIHYYQQALEIYLSKQRDSIDPTKVALLEKNIAIACFNKGRMAEAIAHFDRVLELWGVKRPKNKLHAIVMLIRNFLYILRVTYFPSTRRKKEPDERQNDIFDLLYKRATFMATMNAFRFVVETMALIKRIFIFDYTKIRNGAVMAHSSSILFSYAGISFKLMRDINKCFEYNAEGSDYRSLLIYNFFKLVNCYLAGDWSDAPAYDERLIEENLRLGEFFTAPGYHVWMGFLTTEQGNFSLAQFCAEKASRIGAEYESDYARTCSHHAKSKLLFKQRKLAEALRSCEEALAFQKNVDRNPQELLSLLGIKAGVHVLKNEMTEALETLSTCEGIMEEEKHVIPFRKSSYVMARCSYDLRAFMDAIAGTSRADAAILRKQAGKSVRAAARNAMKYYADRTEAFRSTGTYFWLLGNKRRALTWWAKSLKIGKQLNALPELARTYCEIGKRLQQDKSKLRHPAVPGPEECLKNARSMFVQLDLQWDLSEIQKTESSPRQG
jgi:class 3 adenylate cyclase/tRNA A-37 threonylcarbamoyl transferase component Bud32/tetratricopeptide (TPR) repeat protein